MDTDDYYWDLDKRGGLYPHLREVSERLYLMTRDIARYKNIVISGSILGWGDSLIPLFDLCVYVRKESCKELLKWASEYESGDTNMRSRKE